MKKKILKSVAVKNNFVRKGNSLDWISLGFYFLDSI